jgi:transposase-like protein
MTKPLSTDLRQRLVWAVDGGMTRRMVGERFGVAASTAVRWVDQWRRTGGVQPRPQGGDKRSQRIEAHANEILALIDETSRRPAPSCASCRPTAPTSISLKSMSSGVQLLKPSISSLQSNAATSSPQQAMNPSDRKML